MGHRHPGQLRIGRHNPKPVVPPVAGNHRGRRRDIDLDIGLGHAVIKARLAAGRRVAVGGTGAEPQADGGQDKKSEQRHGNLRFGAIYLGVNCERVKAGDARLFRSHHFRESSSCPALCRVSTS
jgi:hypothetical protein